MFLQIKENQFHSDLMNKYNKNKNFNWPIALLDKTFVTSILNDNNKTKCEEIF